MGVTNRPLIDPDGDGQFTEDQEETFEVFESTNFHTGIPVVIKPSKLQENAAQFQELYSRRLNAPGQENKFAFLSCYVNEVHTLFKQPPLPGSLPPSEPSLSSLGIIATLSLTNMEMLLRSPIFGWVWICSVEY